MCKQAVRARFLDAVDVHFMSFPGTARLPDGTLRLYADVSTPWRLFGWRCVLEKDAKTIKSVTIVPFCGAVGNALNDRTQVLKRPTVNCISSHDKLR